MSNGGVEILYPAGGVIDLDDVPSGDLTLSDTEMWGNESQESGVALVWPDDYPRLKAVCEREHLPCAVIGKVTGDGKLVVRSRGQVIVDVPLVPILGAHRQKTFTLERVSDVRKPLELPPNLTVQHGLDLVLRLPSVASKRWTVVEGDHSVGGLVAQQQQVGPYQACIADCTVKAASHFGLRGNRF